MNPLALFSGIGNLWESVFGSKLKRDEQNAATNSSIHAQFSKEFGNNQNLFDSLIDGLNRLPRPTFAFGIIYLFGLCWQDPEKFATGAGNLALIPLEMWGLLSIIVTFYFGDRVIKGWGKGKIREHIAKNTISTVKPLILDVKPDAPDHEWKRLIKSKYSFK